MFESPVSAGIIKLVSFDHIRSAVQLAGLAHQEELIFNSHNEEGTSFYSHKAYVTGSIMLCVAFIEARINELIVGATINVNPWNKGIVDENTYKSFQQAGILDGINNLRLLEKYQFVLSFFGKQQFKKEKPPYQDVSLLISLRNKLVHFKPEIQWLNDEHYFLKHFKSKKLSLNPIVEKSKSSEFPDILLGYGCAKWAIMSSLKFVTDFDARLKLYSNYMDLEKECKGLLLRKQKDT